MSAVLRSELVVLPTDTVYRIGADAFSATAVEASLAVKAAIERRQCSFCLSIGGVHRHPVFTRT